MKQCFDMRNQTVFFMYRYWMKYGPITIRAEYNENILTFWIDLFQSKSVSGKIFLKHHIVSCLGFNWLFIFSVFKIIFFKWLEIIFSKHFNFVLKELVLIKLWSPIFKIFSKVMGKNEKKNAILKRQQDSYNRSIAWVVPKKREPQVKK